jgi:hypothetical protein
MHWLVGYALAKMQLAKTPFTGGKIQPSQPTNQPSNQPIANTDIVDIAQTEVPDQLVVYEENELKVNSTGTV